MVKVAFIVNGNFDSPMGHRAREFATRLGDDYDIHIAYRSQEKLRSIFTFFSFLRNSRPDVTYVFDIGYSGVVGAALFRLLFRNALVIETGDAIYELTRSTGSRGSVGLWLTRLLESFALRVADKVVVRGTFHQRLLAQKGIIAEVIQDAVDVESFAPRGDGLRERSGLEDTLTVGVVGSSVWSEKLQMCYGWELVETLRLLKDKPVKGIMIGDGTGLSHLKESARKYGIQDKILFWGHVPFDELREKLQVIDICLSTQTNDIVGQVRTTGKLPLYMAAGRYILASEVGEASLVLEKEMLVPYDGVKDEDYPRKLAQRIDALLEQPANLGRRQELVPRATLLFDYSTLATRVGKVIDEALSLRRRVLSTDIAEQVNDPRMRKI